MIYLKYIYNIKYLIKRIILNNIPYIIYNLNKKIYLNKKNLKYLIYNNYNILKLFYNTKILLNRIK